MHSLRVAVLQAQGLRHTETDSTHQLEFASQFVSQDNLSELECHWLAE